MGVTCAYERLWVNLVSGETIKRLRCISWEWRQLFKGVACLSDWVNRQPRSERLTCIGDGHDGILNLVTTIQAPRQEILDWYHLVENLHFCGRFPKSASSAWRRISGVGMWRRRSRRSASGPISGSPTSKLTITNHRHRIPNYSQLQA